MDSFTILDIDMVNNHAISNKFLNNGFLNKKDLLGFMFRLTSNSLCDHRSITKIHEKQKATKEV
jgi:hypothetical protein